MQLHTSLGKANKEKFVKEEKKRKEDEDGLRNIEKQLKEKIKKVENLEKEVNQLEQEVELEKEQKEKEKQELGVGTDSTVEMFGGAAAGGTERKDEESYPIGKGSPTASSTSQFLSF